MPQHQEKRITKKLSTGPSQGLLRRIFGSTFMTPEVEEGIRIAKSEMPDLGSIESYGPISRLLMGNAMGYTSPGRTIYLNPTQLSGQNPQEIADTITHEQEHVRQMQGRGYSAPRELFQGLMEGGFKGIGEPYHRRPDEMRAYQAEFERRKRMKRGQTAIPSFLTGKMQVPTDITLRKPGINVGPSVEQRQQMLLRGMAGR